MNISSIQPTARFKADLANGQSIEIEIGFISAAWESMDRINKGEKTKVSTVIKAALIDAVCGWNLVQGSNEVILCTEENKKKYLPIILNLQTKEDTTFGIDLLNFAGDSENFLKN